MILEGPDQDRGLRIFWEFLRHGQDRAAAGGLPNRDTQVSAQRTDANLGHPAKNAFVPTRAAQRRQSIAQGVSPGKGEFGNEIQVPEGRHTPKRGTSPRAGAPGKRAELKWRDQTSPTKEEKLG